MKGRKSRMERSRARARARASLDNERDNPSCSWSMSVLPYVLTSDTLSQLPMKKIFQFRRVCKAWRHLLSGQDSEVLQSLKLHDTLVLSSPKEGGKNNIYLVELEPGHEHVMKFNYSNANLPNRSRLKLVGSCNGLLWFYDLESTKTLYIINPITGEYVHTPQKLRKERLHVKSVQAVWRNIPNIPFPVNTEYFGVPLNGAIHWIVGYEIPMSLGLICAFDIDGVKLRPILPPPNFDDLRGGMVLGVLGEESWTKEFVIPRNSPDSILFWEIRPMMILKDGNVLILHDDETLELYDPRRKKFGNIKIKGASSVLEAVTYVANFGSLRDIVKEEYVRDLYVKSK
ncbi:F-box protein At3g07870-like [Castanea sativa]|uniref:F-box protein At3g07870-like n=1 Tax=Castanea sativa TaxID=21020 RepID=UPI003F64D408